MIRYRKARLLRPNRRRTRLILPSLRSACERLTQKESEQTMGRPRGSKNTKWFQVEQDYTSGITQPDGSLHFPTLEELSISYGIKLNTIYQRAYRGGWADKQAEFRQELSNKIQERKQKDFFEDVLKIDRRSFQIIHSIQAAVLKKLLVKAVVTTETGQTKEEYVTNDRLSPLHIKQLAEASNLCVDMKDKIMGGKQAEDDDAMKLFCRSVDSLIKSIREHGPETEP